MMEKLLGTLEVLVDYVSAIAPHGVIGGIVFVSGFVILALGIDRVRSKVDELTNDVSRLSRQIDSLSSAIDDRRASPHLVAKAPVGARDSEVSLEDIRKRLEALSTPTDRKNNVERR